MNKAKEDLWVEWLFWVSVWVIIGLFDHWLQAVRQLVFGLSVDFQSFLVGGLIIVPKSGCFDSRACAVAKADALALTNFVIAG